MAKMNSLAIIASGLALLLSACSTAPVRETHTLSARCRGFCDQISDAASQSGHSDLSRPLCELARCETGDKCVSKIHSPNRLYHGAFQFSAGTWRSQCGPIFARAKLSSCKASSKMSDLKCSTACSAEIISQKGYGDWPACGKVARSGGY
jgi:hypothetical protein